MLRDPPHYLKPLKTTTTPKRLVWLHCKGNVRRVRNHYEKHFIAGAVGTTHWTSRSKVRKDTMTVFSDPEALWAFIDGYCIARQKVVLFTYDLAEQIRLSRALTCLPSSGWSLDKIVMDRTAAWCSLRNGNRGLVCCDLKSWVPLPWAKITTDIDGGRARKVEVTAGPHRMADVCMIRAAYIRAAVLQILEWIEGENLGPFRPTGSGQSYAAFRRRFSVQRLLVHDDIARLAAERQAMHTGRAEVWRHGSLRNGPYVEYDLHAAYATIGRDCEVPTVAKHYRERIHPDRLREMCDKYAMLADVTVETEVECLPVTVGKRTMWPIGRFRTTLWDPELQLAFQYANRIEVHRAWSYAKAPALESFCSYVLDNMEGQTQVYGPLCQRVLKHWSRCLVGRLGLRYRAWHKFGEQDPPDVRLVTYRDLDSDEITEMLLAGSQRLLLGDLEESPDSLPQIPGWVMSECRRRLWGAMLDVGLANVVYVDTDSVIVHQHPAWGGWAPRFGRDEHRWDKKGVYARMTIHGPRNLSVDHDRRVSGLPLDARPIAPLHFEGEVTRGMSESLKSGDLDHTVSLPREFHLTAHDLRRQHSPGGTTAPFRLEME